MNRPSYFNPPLGFIEPRQNDVSFFNQKLAARKLLAQEGPDAVYNPHALIGRDCRCGSCFCCAALHVWRDWTKGTERLLYRRASQ